MLENGGNRAQFGDSAIAAVDVVNVGKRYKSRGATVIALEAASLRVRPGEFVSLLGPSGCGKTTLLKIIGGLTRLSSGRVRIGGTSVAEAVRRRAFGFVFQDAVLLPWRRVISNVELLLDITKYPGDKRRLSQELLARVGLEGFEERYASELSGGMQQRVALARALAMDPDILLMDEPFAALDSITRDEMGEHLLTVWGQRKTVLFVTHSIPEAVFLSDRVAVMSARPGRISAVVDIDLPRPRSAAVRDSPEYAAHVSELRAMIRR